jgi:hypothetical protein
MVSEDVATNESEHLDWMVSASLGPRGYPGDLGPARGPQTVPDLPGNVGQASVGDDPPLPADLVGGRRLAGDVRAVSATSVRPAGVGNVVDAVAALANPVEAGARVRPRGARALVIGSAAIGVLVPVADVGINMAADHGFGPRTRRAAVIDTVMLGGGLGLARVGRWREGWLAFHIPFGSERFRKGAAHGAIGAVADGLAGACALYAVAGLDVAHPVPSTPSASDVRKDGHELTGR